MTTAAHKPVMLRESLDILNLAPGMVVADCTAGYGGHSGAILGRIMPSGFLVAIDRDPEALAAAEANIAGGWREDAGREGSGSKPYAMVHSNFSRIKEILGGLGIDGIDAAIMDLGVNSHQLDEGGRGFSYRHPGALDMRMDQTEEGPTALDALRDLDAGELERIIRDYGEERWSRRIARFIVEERVLAPIETTDQLVTVIKKAIPAGAREEGPHPARRTFQALRIYVNKELEVLEGAITDTVESLKPGGRLAVIGFHSLEDRLVKDTFRKLAAGCVCPKDMPVCVCGKTSQGKMLTPKPILPGYGETEENTRARSAKLRAFQKAK
ncbi:MAG: 16S rRNA (cytosine(1402)-N(4))-methyltransferase RsmH [Clostridiales bacterium]|nr:16S rRNA (cytosine(1402)-N(4))-methyltransferase RsmH [Clostridiales bacterium]